tara:strand:- start:66651 stop:67652 length:1002 start_codon:yes stop_codon:yes gene_type:complete
MNEYSFMVEIMSSSLGLYPLPDWTKDELSKLKGHQRDGLISGNESSLINAVYDSAREFIIGEQQTAGIDLIVEGQLRWDDMLVHPLIVHESVEARGLVRYYDNNNFYREPVVVGELTSNGDVARELEKTSELVSTPSAIFPGPYSLSKLATDEYYGSETKFLEAMGGFVREEIQGFPEMSYLTLLEPSLAVDPPHGDEKELIADLLKKIKSVVKKELIIQTYWGAFDEETYATLLELGVGIGFDFVTAAESNLKLLSEQGAPKMASVGAINGQNTNVESPEEVQNLIKGMLEKNPDIQRVVVNPNTGLFYLPENRFTEKLTVLGSIAGMEEAL